MFAITRTGGVPPPPYHLVAHNSSQPSRYFGTAYMEQRWDVNVFKGMIDCIIIETTSTRITLEQLIGCISNLPDEQREQAVWYFVEQVLTINLLPSFLQQLLKVGTLQEGTQLSPEAFLDAVSKDSDTSPMWKFFIHVITKLKNLSFIVRTHITFRCYHLLKDTLSKWGSTGPHIMVLKSLHSILIVQLCNNLCTRKLKKLKQNHDTLKNVIEQIIMYVYKSDVLSCPCYRPLHATVLDAISAQIPECKNKPNIQTEIYNLTQMAIKDNKDLLAKLTLFENLLNLVNANPQVQRTKNGEIVPKKRIISNVIEFFIEDISQRLKNIQNMPQIADIFAKVCCIHTAFSGEKVVAKIVGETSTSTFMCEIKIFCLEYCSRATENTSQVLNIFQDVSDDQMVLNLIFNQLAQLQSVELCEILHHLSELIKPNPHRVELRWFKKSVLDCWLVGRIRKYGLLLSQPHDTQQLIRIIGQVIDISPHFAGFAREVVNILLPSEETVFNFCYSLDNDFITKHFVSIMLMVSKQYGGDEIHKQLSQIKQIGVTSRQGEIITLITDQQTCITLSKSGLSFGSQLSVFQQYAGANDTKSVLSFGSQLGVNPEEAAHALLGD